MRDVLSERGSFGNSGTRSAAPWDSSSALPNTEPFRRNFRIDLQPKERFSLTSRNITGRNDPAPGIQASCRSGRRLGVELEANVDGVVGIHCARVELDVLNFSVFVYDKCCSARPLVFVAAHGVFLQNPVGGEDFVIHVTEKWKRHADLLRESRVGGRAVNAKTENFGVVRL